MTTKYLKSPENSPKNAKNNNLLKTKRIIKLKYKLSGSPDSAFSLPGVAIRLSFPRQLRHWL